MQQIKKYVIVRKGVLIMPKITGVHHIALTPTNANYEKTVSFYKDLLGFAEVRAWVDGERKFALLSCGDNTVMEIMNTGATDNLGDGALVHLAFCCDDVDGMVEIVRNAGYEVTMEPKDISLDANGANPMPVRIAFFRGPVGEHLEMFKVY